MYVLASGLTPMPVLVQFVSLNIVFLAISRVSSMDIVHIFLLINVYMKFFIALGRVYSHGWKAGARWPSVLNSRLRGPGSSPGWGHCVVFLGKTLSQCLSPPRSVNGYRQTVKET